MDNTDIDSMGTYNTFSVYIIRLTLGYIYGTIKRINNREVCYEYICE